MRRNWDGHTKARIVLEGLSGACVSEVCKRHGVQPGLYYRWRNHFLANAHRAFEDPVRQGGEAELVQENERLKRLVGEMALELNNKNPNR